MNREPWVNVEVGGAVFMEPLEVFVAGEQKDFMESIAPELYFLIENVSHYLWERGTDYIKVSFDFPKVLIRDYSVEYSKIALDMHNKYMDGKHT
uniref:Uncharacterized protein n=1 Tax=viral metagenome TaxID=1070528 RepID=A0A6H1ZPW7_9ZZZZ